jgi:hypothetical protein
MHNILLFTLNVNRIFIYLTKEKSKHDIKGYNIHITYEWKDVFQWSAHVYRKHFIQFWMPKLPWFLFIPGVWRHENQECHRSDKTDIQFGLKMFNFDLQYQV